MTEAIYTTPVEGKQQANNGNTTGKQRSNKAKRELYAPQVTEVDRHRSYATIMCVAASGSKIGDDKFPLYKPFTLSPESIDVYIKVNKSTVVHLGTQERFRAEGTGHFVSTQLNQGGK